jgi:DNA processing protein
LVLERLGGPAGFEAASAQALQDAGLSEKRAKQARETDAQAFDGAWVVVGSPGYPRALLDLACPPPVVFCRGRTELLGSRCLTVVGSRACTPYGQSVARQLGAGAARGGGTLLSGGAWGIDTHAHRGALSAGGPTIAVLGAGLATSQPSRARRLHAEILEQGGVVASELAPLDPAARWTFPRRNRILAAMGLATVVVQARERSGALYTASHARELGRPLFAVPGRIDGPASVGSNGLLAEGVAPLLQIEQAVGLIRPRDSVSAQLLCALEHPAGLDALCVRSRLPPRVVLRTLTTLELTGTVRRLPDSRYALVASDVGG